MYVNGTCVAQIFIAPDVVQKLFSGEHLIWRGSKEIQKFQLLWRHVDDLSVIHDRVVGQIDDQIRIFHTFDLWFCLSGSRPDKVSQHCFDSLLIQQIEWLDDIVVSAKFQTKYFVKYFTFGRKHNDRYVGLCPISCADLISSRCPGISDPVK